MASREASQRDPAAVFDRAISRFENDGAAEPFIAAPKFQGAKPGYHFSSGSRGVGYYLDDPSAGAPGDGAGPSRPAAAAPVARPQTGAELLLEAEDAAGEPQMQIVDAKTLRKLVTTLERKVCGAREIWVCLQSNTD